MAHALQTTRAMINRLLVLASLLSFACVEPQVAMGPGSPPASGADGGADAGPTCPIHSRRAHPASPLSPGVTIQRGVDRAAAFSTQEAATLANTDGVTWSGAYLGGACNAGSGWAADALTALNATAGWSFLPIYVGQQSATICHAHDLSQAAGTLDGNDAAALMQSYQWQPNTMIPVALDVEAGTYSADPAGTTDYVQAWLDAVHGAGYLAYVYSSPTALNAFAAAGLPIDAAWAASYFYDGFVDVSPSDLQQLGANFDNHNRAWQYAGDVAVSGAGLLDCDTSDLLLAPPPGGSNQPAPPPDAPPPPTQCGRIAQDQGLAAGESLNACGCRVQLALQPDGNLVLSSDQVPIWSAGIAGENGAVAVMQEDGNFVVYSTASTPVWATGTDGHPGAGLSVQDDGNLVVRDAAGAILWATNTMGHP
jgi:hypothetical protein